MSSLFSQASLVVEPAVYEDGLVYATKPFDGSGDLTFSRGSDIEATRVASNGYIEKAKVNLLLQSNSFDTTWIKSDTSVTSNQAGYDGTNNAWLLTTTALNGSLYQNNTTSNIASFSCYAKAGTSGWVRLRFDNTSSTDANIWVNLSDGSIGTNSGISSYVQSVGSGWYRIVLNQNATDLNNVRIYASDTDGSNSTSGNIYIQDAQLNYGFAAQEYQETTTTSVVSGITDDMPRLDYSGGASCPSLLLEPERTNIVTSTEYLSYGWSLQNGATISFESVTAPDGSGLVTKIQSNAGDTQGRNQDSFGTLGTNYMYSGFFKGTGVATRLRFRNNQGEQVQYNIDASGNFTLYDASSANHGIEDFPNGWKRIWFETTSSAVATNYIQIYPDVENGTGSVYAWGMQAEEGTYVTSYIPNYGILLGVTRPADNMDTTFASPFATDGSATIFFHELGLADSADINTTSASYRYQAAAGNYVSLTTNDTAWRVRVQGGGDANFKGLNDHPKTSPIKVAIVVTSNTFSVYANGIKELDNEPLTTTADFSSIQDFITNIEDNTGARKTVQHLVFPTALTDAECIALTA